jgi:restriction system protein
MNVWLVRAGRHGEFEEKFLQEGRVYVTWDHLSVDIGRMTDRKQLLETMVNTYPGSKLRALQNNVSQVWPFAHAMEKGDLVILPSKMQASIFVAEITGDYQYAPQGPDPFFHWRSVKWISDAIPRSNFGQDLLYSLGAFMTICRITRNNAVVRIEAMRSNQWRTESLSDVVGGSSKPSIESRLPEEATDSDRTEFDIGQVAQDQIAATVKAKFSGHGLTRLVDAILRAQGYTTHVSPKGADGGVDILAGLGPLGFSSPRLCVEVKSEASAIDRPTVDKLLGAMTKFGAQEGLFVSLSGFKSNVQKDLSTTFFRLRLWSATELFEALFANYDKLDAEIKAELPLKQIWTLALPDEDAGD